ncbi:DnrO protein [Luteimonas yindakuii]|uniref:DnrO protein n=1 Tax=Luteimonas yindakuii TaxID=2565782 RepID=UPI0010A54F72|nr:DnrO protein [Luteimonas yindakuii]QCO68333.1 DnrO protein [Luteimonas yindakuii]
MAAMLKLTLLAAAFAVSAGLAHAAPPAHSHAGHHNSPAPTAQSHADRHGHAADAADAADAAHAAHATHATHATHADHANHSTHRSPLDAPDVKWTPDAPLMAGMRRLHAALDGANTGDAQHALRLASEADAAVAYMFEHCELEAEPDVALHGVLARVMAGTQALRDDPEDLAPLATMRDAVADYPRLFDDPGFPGPMAAHPLH